MKAPVNGSKNSEGKKGLRHEIWQEPDGLTGLFLAGVNGSGARALLEKDSKLIHTFYASSNYEAMTIYYEYMSWGKYETTIITDTDADKEIYEELRKK